MIVVCLRGEPGGRAGIGTCVAPLPALVCNARSGGGVCVDRIVRGLQRAASGRQGGCKARQMNSSAIAKKEQARGKQCCQNCAHQTMHMASVVVLMAPCVASCHRRCKAPLLEPEPPPLVLLLRVSSSIDCCCRGRLPLPPPSAAASARSNALLPPLGCSAASWPSLFSRLSSCCVGLRTASMRASECGDVGTGLLLPPKCGSSRPN